MAQHSGQTAQHSQSKTPAKTPVHIKPVENPLAEQGDFSALKADADGKIDASNTNIFSAVFSKNKVVCFADGDHESPGIGDAKIDAINALGKMLGTGRKIVATELPVQLQGAVNEYMHSSGDDASFDKLKFAIERGAPGLDKGVIKRADYLKKELDACRENHLEVVCMDDVNNATTLDDPTFLQKRIHANAVWVDNIKKGVAGPDGKSEYTGLLVIGGAGHFMNNKPETAKSPDVDELLAKGLNIKVAMVQVVDRDYVAPSAMLGNSKKGKELALSADPGAHDTAGIVINATKGYLDVHSPLVAQYPEAKRAEAVFVIKNLQRDFGAAYAEPVSGLELSAEEKQLLATAKEQIKKGDIAGFLKTVDSKGFPSPADFDDRFYWEDSSWHQFQDSEERAKKFMKAAGEPVKETAPPAKDKSTTVPPKDGIKLAWSETTHDFSTGSGASMPFNLNITKGRT